MTPEITKETSATNAPRGLASMFGHTMPQKYVTTAAATKTKNDMKGKGMEEEQSQGGGSWKTKQRKGKSLATYARLGKTVTITSSPVKNHIDDENDIVMGGLGKKKKTKRFSPYGNRKKTNTLANPTVPVVERVDVLVQGVQTGSEEALIQFLQLKSKKEWQPLDCKVANNEMLITVNGHMIAMSIIRLDGYMFGTQQLRIQLFNETTSSPLTNQTTLLLPNDNNNNKKSSTMDLLRTFLKSRWNGPHQYLNLEAMHEDPFLKKHGIKPPGVKGSPAVVGPAMMKLASEMFQEEGVMTVSLANNRLHNVQSISTLAQYLPNIQNLSLQNNLIKNVEGLEAISGTGKLVHLKELVLTGNPLKETEIKQRGDDRGYVRHIVKKFPHLKLLDGQDILLTQEEAQSIQKTGKILPLDNQSNFFDQEQTHTMIMTFLEGYFKTFDLTDTSLRLSLATSIYDQHATFSVSTLLKLRSQTKLKRKEKKKLMIDDDTIEWTSINRNLKLNNQKQAAKGLALGAEAIGEMLQKLPPTKHDFTNTKEFVMDAFQTPTGYILTLHGEFKQDDDSLPFSFDRTFILKPSLPGSLAANAGSPFTIQADNLIVRDYIGPQGFQPHQNQHIQSIFTTMPSLSTVAI
ncbi:unnamed protein product [Cunninghamella blakesleeana]